MHQLTNFETVLNRKLQASLTSTSLMQRSLPSAFENTRVQIRRTEVQTVESDYNLFDIRNSRRSELKPGAGRLIRC